MTQPDLLNQIGVLNRREIEARILLPFVDALAEELPREDVIALLRDTIIRIAREQGAAMAVQFGDNDLETFRRTLSSWKQDNALEIDVIESSEDRFSFNVTRCRYAEMYQALGIPELGAVLSCNRDYSLMDGFNPEVGLQRSQTIMEGAAFCDFRYRLPEK